MQKLITIIAFIFLAGCGAEPDASSQFCDSDGCVYCDTYINDGEPTTYCYGTGAYTAIYGTEGVVVEQGNQ